MKISGIKAREVGLPPCRAGTLYMKMPTDIACWHSLGATCIARQS